MTDDLVIDIQGLRKSFGKFEALRGVDLAVPRGEVHGFLGPNGAGKSTTIRVLLGLLKANAGQIRLLGGDPWTDVVDLHARLAYVPGDVSLWPGMSGGEAIDLLGSLRGGLDPLMENVFQEVVGEAVDRGATVLLSSHIMSEVETLADKLSIIRTGEIVETGTLEELRGHARTTIHATLKTVPSRAQVPVLHEATFDGNRLTATVDTDRIDEAMTALAPFGFSSLDVAPPSLESLFLRLYEDDENRSEATEGLW